MNDPKYTKRLLGMLAVTGQAANDDDVVPLGQLMDILHGIYESVIFPAEMMQDIKDAGLYGYYTDPRLEITVTPTTDVPITLHNKQSTPVIGTASIDWGDGTVETFDNLDVVPALHTHTYSDTNSHTITIRGRIINNDGAFISPQSTVTSVIGLIPQSPDAYTNAPATDRCAQMFMGCENITTAKVIVYPFGDYNDFNMDGYLKQMFSGCTGLETLDIIMAPLPKHATSFNDYMYQMCYECPNLTHIGHVRFPYDVFHDISQAEGCYYQAFYNAGINNTELLTKDPRDIINGNSLPGYLTECFSSKFPNTRFVPNAWLQDYMTLTAEITVKSTSSTYSVLYLRNITSFKADSRIDIDWGDGTSTTYAAGATVPADTTHYYSKTGTYVVKIEGPMINPYRNTSTVSSIYPFFDKYNTTSSSNIGYIELNSVKGYLNTCTQKSTAGFLANLFYGGDGTSSYQYRFFNNIQEIDVIIPPMDSVTTLNYFMYGFVSRQNILTSCRVHHSTTVMPSTVTSADNYMRSAFINCPMLQFEEHITIPKLTDSVLSMNGFLYQTFMGTSLSHTIPVQSIPSNVTSANDYCTGLYRNTMISKYNTGDIPDLDSPSLTSASYFLSHLFDGCVNLVLDGTEVLPKIVSPTLRTAQYYYAYTFSGCSSLTGFKNIIPDLESNTVTDVSYFLYYVFSGALSLTGMTHRLPVIKSTSVTSLPYMYNYMFAGGGPVASLNLPSLEYTPNVTNVSNYASYVYDNNVTVGNTSIHVGYLDMPKLATINNFLNNMIYGCINLTGVTMDFDTNLIRTSVPISIKYFMYNTFLVISGTTQSGLMNTIEVVNFPEMPSTTTTLAYYMTGTFSGSACKVLSCPMPDIELPELTSMTYGFSSMCQNLTYLTSMNIRIPNIIAPKLKTLTYFMRQMCSYTGYNGIGVSDLDIDVDLSSFEFNTFNGNFELAFEYCRTTDGSAKVHISEITLSNSATSLTYYMQYMFQYSYISGIDLQIGTITAPRVGSINYFMYNMFYYAKIASVKEGSYINTIVGDNVSSADYYMYYMFAYATMTNMNLPIANMQTPKMTSCSYYLANMFYFTDIVSIDIDIPAMDQTSVQNVNYYMYNMFNQSRQLLVFNKTLPGINSDTVKTATNFCMQMFYASSITSFTTSTPTLISNNLTNADNFLYGAFGRGSIRSFSGTINTIESTSISSISYYMYETFTYCAISDAITIPAPITPNVTSISYYLQRTFNNIPTAYVFNATIEDLEYDNLTSADNFCDSTFSHSSVTTITKPLPKIKSDKLVSIQNYMISMFASSNLNGSVTVPFYSMDLVKNADYFMSKTFSGTYVNSINMDKPSMNAIESLAHYMDNCFYNLQSTSFSGTIRTPSTFNLKTLTYERYQIFQSCGITTMNAVFEPWESPSLVTADYVCCEWFKGCTPLQSISSILPAPASAVLQTCDHYCNDLFYSAKLVSLPNIFQPIPSMVLTSANYYMNNLVENCQKMEIIDLDYIPAIQSPLLKQVNYYCYYAAAGSYASTLTGNIPALPENAPIESANYYCAYCFAEGQFITSDVFPPHVPGASLISAIYYMAGLYSLTSKQLDTTSITRTLTDKITDLHAPNLLYADHYMYRLFYIFVSNRPQDTINIYISLGDVGNLTGCADGCDMTYYMGNMFVLRSGENYDWTMSVRANILPQVVDGNINADYYMYRLIFSSAYSGNNTIIFSGTIGGLTANRMTTSKYYMHRMIESSTSSSKFSAITFNGTIGGLSADSLTSLTYYMYRMIWVSSEQSSTYNNINIQHMHIGPLKSTSLTAVDGYLKNIFYTYNDVDSNRITLYLTCNLDIDMPVLPSCHTFTSAFFNLIYIAARVSYSGIPPAATPVALNITINTPTQPTLPTNGDMSGYCEQMIYINKPASSSTDYSSWGVFLNMSYHIIVGGFPRGVGTSTASANRYCKNLIYDLSGSSYVKTSDLNINIAPLPQGPITDADDYLMNTFSRVTMASPETNPIVCNIPALPIGIVSANRYLAYIFASSNFFKTGLPALPSSVTSANGYLAGVYGGITVSGTMDVGSIEALPSGVIYADNYLYEMMHGNTNITGISIVIPSLPDGVQSAERYLMDLLYNCNKLYQIFNLVFPTEAPIVVSATDAYKRVLNSVGTSATSAMTKTAASIIVNATTPPTARNAISNKFSDFASLATNWKQTSST